MVTIKDIARESGVSYSTVSVVIGNRTTKLPLSEKTRIKVLNAATRLGYHRNALATQIQTGKTGFVSFISPEVNHEYIFKIFTGASVEAMSHGYTVKLHELPSGENVLDSENIRKLYNSIFELRPEGIIFVRDIPDFEYMNKIAKQLGIASACANSVKSFGLDVTIYPNSICGEIKAVEYLHSLGHRNFCFISDEKTRNYALFRQNGFIQAVEKYKIPLKKEWIFEEDYRNNNKIDLFLGKIMKAPEKPTVACCASDYIALQVILSASRLGIDIPGELSVMGYGDIEFTKFLTPSISTVSEHFDVMGRTAFRRLLAHIKDKSLAPESFVLPVSVIKRDSTGPASFRKNSRKAKPKQLQTQEDIP